MHKNDVQDQTYSKYILPSTTPWYKFEYE